MMQTELLCLLLVFADAVKGDDQVLERKLDELLQRMTILEARDVVSQKKITVLESEIATCRNVCKAGQLKNDNNLIDEKKHGTSEFPATLNQHGSQTRHRRAVAQTKVAFFAIAADYDYHNMNAGVKLNYSTPVTNIGNGFNNNSGTFIAPVKGTYMFFATVAGNIHHFNYYNIDLNGKVLAKIFMGSTAGQGSQTVIATLKPGDSVSVKSGDKYNGAYRLDYTSIAGFLLYENYHPQPVGK